MPAIDHGILRWMRTAGRITAGRMTLWAWAQSGDLLSQFLQGGPRKDVYALYERMRVPGPVHRSRTGVYVVTSHTLCSQVLRDPRCKVRDLRNRPADFGPPPPPAEGGRSPSSTRTRPITPGCAASPRRRSGPS